MLRRVLDVDGLKCPRCSTPMVVLAFLTDPAIIRRTIDHLKRPSAPPPLAPARGPVELNDLFFNEDAHRTAQFADPLTPLEPPTDHRR